MSSKTLWQINSRIVVALNNVQQERAKNTLKVERLNRISDEISSGRLSAAEITARKSAMQKIVMNMDKDLGKANTAVVITP